MVKRILLSIVMLVLIAYLVVAVSAFNRKPADQTCRDLELVIKGYRLRRLHHQGRTERYPSEKAFTLSGKRWNASPPSRWNGSWASIR